VEAVIDPRVRDYATLLVDRCLDAQADWQVMVKTSPLARPLVEEVVRALGRRGAYPIVRLSWAEENWPFAYLWAEEAREEVVARQPSLEAGLGERIDAWMNIGAPENTHEGSDLDPGKRGLLSEANRPLLERRLRLEIPWVACRYPTAGLAQAAGMTTEQFEDFVYGACLIDWDEEGRKMQRIADRFDAAEEVRIVGRETDIRFSLAGRHGEVDDGHYNMPGGEVFYSPVEDSTEGVVSFTEYPAVDPPDEVSGVRFRYEGGRIVEASAESNEEALMAKLDRDEGARRLGEFGIGCNPGIQRHVKETLFDEKIYGTIHLAIGAGIPSIGGTNVSSVHWDMVKELRNGGRIECDGEVVQENGEWTF
jgi:aminopeptidase